jgi:hypothetical protein
LIVIPPPSLLNSDYDVTNGSVFQVAAEVNGVPYIPSQSVLDNKNQTSSSTSAPGVPSAASAKKVLPVFIILQLLFSGFTVGGAVWLAWGDDMSKYERVADRSTTFIPARGKGHQKYESIVSVASDTPFSTELERGTLLRGHRPMNSITDLTSNAALMGTSSARHSMESVGSLEDSGDIASLRRMLESTKPSGGYLDHRRNSLFLG